MIEDFIDYWWLPVLRGVLAILFGWLALFLAHNMYTTLTQIMFRVSLVLIFGLYVGMSALLTIVAAILIRHAAHQWTYVCQAVILVALCFTVLMAPTLRLETVILLTVGHAAAIGLAESRIALALRRHRFESILLALMAMVSIAAAILLAIFRNGPSGDMSNVMGLYAIFYGMGLVYFGVHLRRHPMRTR